MISPLIDFCNIGSWDEDIILDFCEKHIGLQPNISDETIPRLEESQSRYIGFLENCMADQLDIEFVNRRLQYLRGEPMTFVTLPRGVKSEHGDDFEADPDSQMVFDFRPGGNTWEPEVRFRSWRLDDLESFLDARIVQTLLSKNGKLFSKVRRCSRCNDFFVYRKKTKQYCSDDCRRDTWNEEYVRSGYKKDFMKKKRDEGDPRYYK